MRARMHRPTRWINVALFGLLLLPVSLGQSDGDWVPGDDYLPGDYGRVKYRDIGVSILRTAYDPGQPPVSDAGINAPVFPGDAILTDHDQRAEVELAGGSLVRVDRDTEITFQALPDPYAEVADNTVLQLAEGTIQVTSYLGEMEEFRIDTPSASVYLLGDGDFRIEVNSQGRTRVTSYRGVSELVGDGGSVLVRAGTLSEVFVGSYPLAPEPFNTFAVDSFDSWVDEREAIYTVNDRGSGYGEASAEVYAELPGEVQPYYNELNGYGTWVDTVDYGFVWVPSGVTADWRPYNDGYWEYGPQGYFWVSSEPWGWAPYHYGRWSWVSGYGWGWIPGRVFGGAWVAWSWGDAYVGWAPLGYWNTPVYLGAAYFGYYDRYVWTFNSYTHFGYRDCRRYAVPLDRIGPGLEHTAVVTRPPRIPPNQLNDSQLMRDRAVAYASTDRESRIRSPYRDRRPPTTMRDVERKLSSQALTTRGDSAGRRAGARGAAPGANRQATGTHGTMPTRDRSGSASRAGTPPRASSGERRGSERNAAPPRSQPSRTGASESADRVRDLYRKAASPRTTRQRSDSTSSPVRDRRTPSRSDSNRQGARPSDRTTPPPARTSPRSPSRPSSSRQGAAPPRTAPRRSTPAASPRSSGASGSSGSRSGARPGGSSSGGGSRSGAKPSRSSSSGGSRSGAKPSRSSSSGGSRSGAKPSRSSSSGGSRSGAKPSRSGSGSSSGDKRGGKR